MKKLFFASLILMFSFSSVMAQDEETTFGFYEADIFVEGNLGFNATNDKNTLEKTSTFEFNPKAGYLLTDQLAVGLEFAVGSGKTEVDGTDVNKTSGFGVGVFGRYYFLELGERFKTYGELGIGYGSEKFGVDDAVTVNSLVFGLDLGLNYFIKDNIALTFGLSDILSYSSSKADLDNAEAVSEFNANINVINNIFETARFGLLFKLN